MEDYDVNFGSEPPVADVIGEIETAARHPLKTASKAIHTLVKVAADTASEKLRHGTLPTVAAVCLASTILSGKAAFWFITPYPDNSPQKKSRF